MGQARFTRAEYRARDARAAEREKLRDKRAQMEAELVTTLVHGSVSELCSMGIDLRVPTTDLELKLVQMRKLNKKLAALAVTP